jgi:hypothetical protein
MKNVMITLDFVLGAAAVVIGAYLVLRGREFLARRLPGTPFKTLLWPGLALLVLAGGSLLAAGVLLMTDIHTGRLVSVEGGVVLAGWGAIMLTATGYRHWLQLTPLVLGIAVIVLSFTIPVSGCRLVI